MTKAYFKGIQVYVKKIEFDADPLSYYQIRKGNGYFVYHNSNFESFKCTANEEDLSFIEEVK